MYYLFNIISKYLESFRAPLMYLFKWESVAYPHSRRGGGGHVFLSYMLHCTCHFHRNNLAIISFPIKLCLPYLNDPRNICCTRSCWLGECKNWPTRLSKTRKKKSPESQTYLESQSLLQIALLPHPMLLIYDSVSSNLLATIDTPS